MIGRGFQSPDDVRDETHVPFVLTVRFGRLRDLLAEHRSTRAPVQRRARGFQHFDFDLLTDDENRCRECGQPDDDHTGDCLGNN